MMQGYHFSSIEGHSCTYQSSPRGKVAGASSKQTDAV